MLNVAPWRAVQPERCSIIRSPGLSAAPEGEMLSPMGDRNVTLLFTDIEGSTRMLDRLGDEYVDVLQAHHDLLRDAFDRIAARRWGRRAMPSSSSSTIRRRRSTRRSTGSWHWRARMSSPHGPSPRPDHRYGDGAGGYRHPPRASGLQRRARRADHPLPGRPRRT